MSTFHYSLGAVYNVHNMFDVCGLQTSPFCQTFLEPASFLKVGNVPRDSLGQQMVVNTRVELCGAFINKMNVTYVNYTVKGEPKDETKGR